VVFANIVNVFDPKLITIGGSIAIKNSELVLRPIIENIRHYTINRIPEIMITPMGDEAVLLGALTIARSLA
jgi:glucokinase